MSPAAVVLVMPVATVALPQDSHHPNLVPLSSTSPDRDVASDASYPVPSLHLHHARSCFRVYQRASPPSPPPTSMPPPTASDNEVSDLLRGCTDVDVQLDLLQHHQRRRRCHLLCHPQFRISCDRDRWRVDDDPDTKPWQCLPLEDHVDDDELVRSGDVTASVMNALYRPSLDFNKMQVSYVYVMIRSI